MANANQPHSICNGITTNNNCNNTNEPSTSNTSQINSNSIGTNSLAKNNNFNCNTCKLDFSNKLGFALHVRQIHNSTDKYKCDLCVKVCTNYPALIRHKIMAHTGSRYA